MAVSKSRLALFCSTKSTPGQNKSILDAFPLRLMVFLSYTATSWRVCPNISKKRFQNVCVSLFSRLANSIVLANLCAESRRSKTDTLKAKRINYKRIIIVNAFNSYEFRMISKKANSRLLLSFYKLVHEL